MGRGDRMNRTKCSSWTRALAAAALCGAAACAGGGLDPSTCKIKALKVEEYKVRPGQAKIGYRVQGTAGSAGVTWIAAKLGPERYIAGKGVNVGPGPFVAVVDIDLTGLPPELLVILEVGGKRCKDGARLPS
jgi:hypothetical protein